jgi:hypothetical protein
MIFSEFQAFRIIAPGLADNSLEAGAEEDKFIPGGVSLDRQDRRRSLAVLECITMYEMLQRRGPQE